MFLSVLLLFLLASPSQQYASWLIESSSCHVELRDTTEVIMNAYIKPSPPTPIVEDDTSVFIQVFNLETKREVHVNTTIINQDDGILRRIIYFDVDSTVERLTNIKYSLKLIASSHFQGLQYVMDAITTPPDLMDTTETTSVMAQQRIRGKFMRSPVVGCSGSRTYGRLGDEGHTFKLLIPPSAVVRENPERGVDVVAGWALGKEAVTLTNSIVFLPSIKVDEGVKYEL